MPTHPEPRRRRWIPRTWWLVAGAVVLAGASLAVAWPGGSPQDAPVREISVSGRRYAFTPDRIEVNQNDLVKIHFTAEDIPHSFTVDAYRIAKRANAGQTVTFEFRADQAGTFKFYCNLAIDDGCRQMHGEIVVRPQ